MFFDISDWQWQNSSSNSSPEVSVRERPFYQFSLDVRIVFLGGSDGSEYVDDGSMESVC